MISINYILFNVLKNIIHHHQYSISIPFITIYVMKVV